MSVSGIVRKIDSTGRIVIPVEFRRALDIGSDDEVEMIFDGTNVMIKKYDTNRDISSVLDSAERYIQDDESIPEEIADKLLVQISEMRDILGGVNG